jgi:hypothetical protein
MRRKYLSITNLSIVALYAAAVLVFLYVSWKLYFSYKKNDKFRQHKGIVGIFID